MSTRRVMGRFTSGWLAAGDVPTEIKPGFPKGKLEPMLRGGNVERIQVHYCDGSVLEYWTETDEETSEEGGMPE